MSVSFQEKVHTLLFAYYTLITNKSYHKMSKKRVHYCRFQCNLVKTWHSTNQLTDLKINMHLLWPPHFRRWTLWTGYCFFSVILLNNYTQIIWILTSIGIMAIHPCYDRCAFPPSLDLPTNELAFIHHLRCFLQNVVFFYTQIGSYNGRRLFFLNTNTETFFF